VLLAFVSWSLIALTAGKVPDDMWDYPKVTEMSL